jgi:hypothetical protein
MCAVRSPKLYYHISRYLKQAAKVSLSPHILLLTTEKIKNNGLEISSKSRNFAKRIVKVTQLLQNWKRGHSDALNDYGM